MTENLLYDTILNYYDIGPGWWRKPLSVKFINGSPSMRVFFLDPAAKLWQITCEGTHDFYESGGSNQFKWIPNGKHGKCSPFLYSGKILVATEKWDAYYAPYPKCSLLFRDGILEVVTHIKSYA